MLGDVRAAAVFVLAHLAAHTTAQAYHGFQWSFGPDFVEDSFQECQKLPLVVQSLTGNTSAVGVPPYYLVAFEPGGVPTTTMVGSDLSQLSWTANHKRGTMLMLTMLDSNKTTGGVSLGLYKMTPGDTSCLPPPPQNIASIKPNVTGTLNTCDPWGLTISGGTKPYTVVLSAAASTTVTNSTMGADDDVFTFIDRADPDGKLMASVVDATGKWGTSTPLIATAGSKNVDCVGLVSSSKTSAEIAQEAADREHAAQQSHQHAVSTGLGVGLGLGIPLVLLLLVGGWWWRRRKVQRELQGTWDNQDVVPRAYSAGEEEMREVDAAGRVGGGGGKRGKGNQSPTNIPLFHLPDYERETAHASSSSNTTSQSQTHSRNWSGENPSAADLSARYRKAREAGTRPNQRSQQNIPRALRGAAGYVGEDGLEPDIIIQHRDGGVVQELPPPYADRLRRERSLRAAQAGEAVPVEDVSPPPLPAKDEGSGSVVGGVRHEGSGEARDGGVEEMAFLTPGPSAQQAGGSSSLTSPSLSTYSLATAAHSDVQSPSSPPLPSSSAIPLSASTAGPSSVSTGYSPAGPSTASTPPANSPTIRALPIPTPRALPSPATPRSLPPQPIPSSAVPSSARTLPLSPSSARTLPSPNAGPSSARALPSPAGPSTARALPSPGGAPRRLPPEPGSSVLRD